MKHIFTTIALALTLSSCGGLPLKSSEIQKDQVKAIRSVAVVGFTAFLPATGLTLGGQTIRNNQMSDDMYQKFSKKLGDTLKVTLVNKKTMLQNPAYTKAYVGTMEGMQNKSMPIDVQNQYLVDQVMDRDGVRLLDVSGRDQLMTALNVDAIASLEVTVILKGMTVAGIGSRKPQSLVTFKVYKKGVEAPVWFESIEGEEATESVGATRFVNETALFEQATKSFETALLQIPNRLN